MLVFSDVTWVLMLNVSSLSWVDLIFQNKGKQGEVRGLKNLSKKSRKCQGIFLIFKVVREESGNVLCTIFPSES